MRGEQRSFDIAALTLLALYVVLMVAAVFVMDWFVLQSWGSRQAIDLWAVSYCGSFGECVSRPLEVAGLGTFRPFAVATLWLTAAAAIPVIVRTGGFLLGRATWSNLSVIGVFAMAASITCALISAYGARPIVRGYGVLEPSLAPFVLIAAHLVGLIAMSCASGRSRPCTIDRPVTNVPIARVVRG